VYGRSSCIPLQMRKSYLKIPGAPHSIHSANRVSVTAHSIEEGRNLPIHRQLPHVMEHIPSRVQQPAYGDRTTAPKIAFSLLRSSHSAECDCDSGRELPCSKAAVHIGTPCNSKGYCHVFLTG
jgi:hypothetical protein